MNAQSLQLLPNDALRHLLAEILQQQTDATILRERKRVKTHTHTPIKGPQRNYRGSKAIGRLWEQHQFLALQLDRQTAGA
jgi:hypothetical protein